MPLMPQKYPAAQTQLAAIDYSYTPELPLYSIRDCIMKIQIFAVQKVTNTSFPYYVPEARVHTFHRFLPKKLIMPPILNTTPFAMEYAYNAIVFNQPVGSSIKRWPIYLKNIQMQLYYR